VRQELLKFLVCPIDKKPLSLQVFSEMGHEIEEGLLTCSEGHWYPIVQSVPEILLGKLRPDYSDFVVRNNFENLRDSSEIGVAQPAVVSDEQSKLKTRESFEAKWEHRPDYGLTLRDFYDNWFAKKMGLPDVDALEKFIASKHSILEVGIGSGQKLLMMAEGTAGTVIGIDISKAAHYAAHNCRGFLNAHVVRCDLHDLP